MEKQELDKEAEKIDRMNVEFWNLFFEDVKRLDEGEHNEEKKSDAATGLKRKGTAK
jgi:hypothetical protein